MSIYAANFLLGVLKCPIMFGLKELGWALADSVALTGFAAVHCHQIMLRFNH
jgi:tryptophan-rich sensory protein